MFCCAQLAQLRHALGQKEGLLRLYAQDANEPTNEGEGEGRRGEWIKDLTEECHELRENNSKLTIEARRHSYEGRLVSMRAKPVPSGHVS